MLAIGLNLEFDTELKGTEAGEIIKVINNYSNTLNLLDDYNRKRITKVAELFICFLEFYSILYTES